MKLSFFGATKVVTGSNFLLESQGKRILIDCGFFQGPKTLEQKNKEKFPYNPKKIDAVIITHAHFDHIGRLPILVQSGFTGKIFATPPTIELSKLVLKDSMEIQEEIFFSKEDIKKTFSLFEAVEYHKEINLAKENKNKLSFKLLDAGHILGSAIIEVFTEKKKIVFSGDLGNPPTPLLRPTEFPSSADYVVIESTYGDKVHKEFMERKNMLEDIIEDTIRKKGVLMIPAFAVERTQEILYEMNELVENRRIPRVPVFVDSPLAINSINIYKKYKKYYNKEASYLLRTGDKIFDFKGLTFTRRVEDSKKINDVELPKIIIAGSGMSTGGRILHHEKRYLAGSKNCLLLISYQVAGTLGRKIKEGAKEVQIFGERVPVFADVKTIEGYSAHPDKDGLFRWLYSIKSSAQLKDKNLLKKIFIVHGEENPSLSLACSIRDKLGIETEIPNYGASYKI